MCQMTSFVLALCMIQVHSHSYSNDALRSTDGIKLWDWVSHPIYTLTTKRYEYGEYHTLTSIYWREEKNWPWQMSRRLHLIRLVASPDAMVAVCSYKVCNIVILVTRKEQTRLSNDFSTVRQKCVLARNENRLLLYFDVVFFGSHLL
jgi:hypothetical protein